MKKRILLLCALLVSVITLSGAANVITFTTAKAVGKTVKLTMTYKGNKPKLTGMTGTPVSGEEVTYTLTSQTVTITGDVTYFDCYCNQLTALDLTHNNALTMLVCSVNQLTALDLSHNTALKTLDCPNNQLTVLDLSHNTALTECSCSENQLTVLDVSKNTALTELFCYGNQIKGEEITRLVKSLPDRTDKEAGEFIVVQEPAPEGNRCLKTDVAIAKGKNWIVKV